jgi:hypothetical protein
VNLDIEALGMPDYIHDYLRNHQRSNGIFIVTDEPARERRPRFIPKPAGKYDDRLLTAEE